MRNVNIYIYIYIYVQIYEKVELEKWERREIPPTLWKRSSKFRMLKYFYFIKHFESLIRILNLNWTEFIYWVHIHESICNQKSGKVIGIFLLRSIPWYKLTCICRHKFSSSHKYWSLTLWRKTLKYKLY